MKWYAYLVGRSSEMIGGCFYFLVDGFGRCFLRLLRRPLEVVVDRLGSRVERIGDLGFDGVETFDRIVVCEREIRLSLWVGVHRRGDASGGVIGGVGKQCRGRVNALCIRRRAQRQVEGVD